MQRSYLLPPTPDLPAFLVEHSSPDPPLLKDFFLVLNKPWAHVLAWSSPARRAGGVPAAGSPQSVSGTQQVPRPLRDHGADPFPAPHSLRGTRLWCPLHRSSLAPARVQGVRSVFSGSWSCPCGRLPLDRSCRGFCCLNRPRHHLTLLPGGCLLWMFPRGWGLPREGPCPPPGV